MHFKVVKTQGRKVVVLTLEFIALLLFGGIAMRCGATTGEGDEHATLETTFASHSAAKPTLPASKRELLL